MSEKPDNVARGPWGVRAVDDAARGSQPTETVVRTPHGTVTFRDVTDADIEASFVDDTEDGGDATSGNPGGRD